MSTNANTDEPMRKRMRVDDAAAPEAAPEAAAERPSRERRSRR